ncbi:MAG: bifunctional chorismate mutase/prephenate dehydrogenase [Oligoflexia bacterium]|nr:bifunctional chorismate mutase/prephenate dehydrogenase [Oligoflexia bacterium]
MRKKTSRSATQRHSSDALPKLRREIDALDAGLLRLLNRRAALVAHIGHLKRLKGIKARNKAREQFILDRVTRLNRVSGGLLPDAVIRSIWNHLIANFRSFEHDLMIRQSQLGQERKKTVSVIGLGLMGGSVALALREFAPEFRRIGYDPDPRSRRSARNLMHRVVRVPEEALRSDFVVLAMPTGAIPEFLRKHRAQFRPGCVVLDLGSTKREICREAERLPKEVRFVGGHPLAGKAVSGSGNADPRLFRQRPFVLVRTRRTDSRAWKEARRFVELLGALPVELGAAEHDRMLAVTSHLPQMLSTSLALLAAKRLKGKRPIHGPAFLDLTRLALSNYEMWRDIARSNAEDISKAIEAYAAELFALRRAIRSGEFRRQFALARKYRERWQRAA